MSSWWVAVLMVLAFRQCSYCHIVKSDHMDLRQTQQPMHPQHPDLVTEVPFEDCGSDHGSLIKLAVDPPCNPTNCTVKRGETVTLWADILPRINASSLRVQVSQVDPNFGFTTNLFPEFDPCDRFNVTCPMVENVPMYSKVEGKFPTSSIPLKINLKIKLMTEDYDSVVCGWAKLILE